MPRVPRRTDLPPDRACDCCAGKGVHVHLPTNYWNVHQEAESNKNKGWK